MHPNCLQIMCISHSNSISKREIVSTLQLNLLRVQIVIKNVNVAIFNLGVFHVVALVGSFERVPQKRGAPHACVDDRGDA